MKKLFTAFFFLWANSVVAQQALVDSLTLELNRAKSDSVKVVLLNQLGEQYIKLDPQKAIEVATQAEQLASSINYLKGKALALNYKGISYMIISEFGVAMTCHQQALKIREQIGDSVGIVSSYVNLGNVTFRNNDFDKALAIYEKGVKFATAINDKKGLSRFYNNMGSIYEHRQDLKKALEYFKNAGSLKKELNDIKGFAVTVHHLGTISNSQGNTQQALKYLGEAHDIFAKQEDIASRLIVLRDISDVHEQNKDYDKAIATSTESLELARKIKSTLDVALSAAKVHKLYALKGDYASAYKYLLVRNGATDTLHSERRRALVAEAEAKYESNKKELENQKLKAENDQKVKDLEYQEQVEKLNYFAMAGTLVLAMVLFLFWRRSQAHNVKLNQVNRKIQQKNREITAQKEAIKKQTKLVQAQKDELENLNTFKNKLFSIISHDLRSPFASVQSLFYLAENKTMNAQDFTRLFKLLGKDYDNAANLLDNLLIWAKTQMAGASIQLQEIDLQKLVKNVFSQVGHTAEIKDISLINQIFEPIRITTDPERLNFVIRNLVMNALKFSQPYGKVTISASEEENDIQIAVQDTGIGMNQKTLTKLFTTQRHSNKGTFNEKGTGIGLMLSKDMLESVKGSIRVESREGEGTTFYISLPKVNSNATGSPMLEASFA